MARGTERATKEAHPLQRETICKPKNEGGLGIRNKVGISQPRYAYQYGMEASP